MANNIVQVKRTSVSGRAPNTTSAGNSQYINAGELALNMPDGILYTSNGSALITIGANLINQNITGNLTTKAIIANGSLGTAGQVLHSNGTAIYWDTDDSGGAGSVNVDAQYVWTNLHTFSANISVGTIKTVNGTSNLVLTTGNTNGPSLTLFADNTYNRATFSFGTNSSIGVGTWSVGSEIDFYSPTTNNLVGYAWGEESANQVNRIAGFGATANGQVQFWSNDAPQVYLTANGNFGVGNNIPSHKLRIEGDISLLSGIHANGSLGSAGQVLTSNGTVVYWAAATGGGYYKGGTATVGTLAAGGQNIFRVNANTLNYNTTIATGENAQATGPIAVASGITLTVESGARVAIV